MSQEQSAGREVIFIASPLEEEHVARIRAHAPERIEVIHEPELLPVPRYVADHVGRRRDLGAGQKARFEECLRRATILFDFVREEPERLAERAPRLRWVQATSSGIGEFLRRTGLDRTEIVFTNAAGVHARPLTEFALLGLLYFFRDVPLLQSMKQAHHWERYTAEGLAGKRALVVGLGGVGREVARRCADLGMEVWGARRSADGERPDGVARLVAQGSLREAMAEIDALVLICPLTEETRGLIGRREIESLKAGAVLVNIARGGVVDEPAMIEALQNGRLRGAALDVFATEPLPDGNPLWDLPNVLVCPHSASTVSAENGLITDLFLDNLDRFLTGRPMRNLFDRARGY